MATKEEGVQAEVKEAEPMEATQEPEARAQEQQVEEARRERTMRERVTATIVAEKVTGQGTDIAVEGNKEQEDVESGHQLLHVSMLQADELPDNRAYLDGCSTVTAFKSKQYLENIRSVKRGVKINCNSGVMCTNEVGDYGTMNVWYIPDGIANIVSPTIAGKAIMWYTPRTARCDFTRTKTASPTLT